MKIFDKTEIEDAIRIASEYDLHLTTELSYEAHDKPVHWGRLNLQFTFIIFTLRKGR